MRPPCAKCGVNERLSYHAYCRECRNASTRAFFRRNPNWNRSTAERRQKANAVAYVRHRVARGQLAKLPCFICGNPKVQGHHYLGYSKRHALDVLWLCVMHHREAERQLWSPVVSKHYSLQTPLTPKTWQERFETFIDKTLDCWLYTGRLNWLGYGEFDYLGKTEGAHRVAYKLKNGEIPAGCIIGHLCNVRRCVNPAHLIAWPKGDDVRYMEECGRGVHPAGESNGRSKLTEDGVRNIRRRYFASECGCYLLAKEYHVSAQTIFAIVNFDLWPNVK